MTPFYQQFFDLMSSGTPFVCVTLVDAVGSIPQERGAKMLVTAEGLQAGTVGGGKIEQRALTEARAMLAEADQPQGKRLRWFDWSLTRDIGMTCGGSVRMLLELHQSRPWPIAVFGAGHIAQALVPLLLSLDCQVTCIDPRPEWLAKLPNSPRLCCIQADDMPAVVANLPPDAFVVLMTMGHGTDRPILLEILKTRRFPYLGVIGSRAKAVRLKQDITEAGLAPECQEAFYCPIGLELGNNQPAEIAVSVAAQLLQERDRWLAKTRKQPQSENAIE